GHCSIPRLVLKVAVLPVALILRCGAKRSLEGRGRWARRVTVRAGCMLSLAIEVVVPTPSPSRLRRATLPGASRGLRPSDPPLREGEDGSQACAVVYTWRLQARCCAG